MPYLWCGGSGLRDRGVVKGAGRAQVRGSMVEVVVHSWWEAGTGNIWHEIHHPAATHICNTYTRNQCGGENCSNSKQETATVNCRHDVVTGQRYGPNYKRGKYLQHGPLKKYIYIKRKRAKSLFRKGGPWWVNLQHAEKGVNKGGQSTRDTYASSDCITTEDKQKYCVQEHFLYMTS